MKDEKTFERKLINSARLHEIHVAELPDDAKRGSTPSLNSDKIYDFGLLHNGIYYGVECKEVNSLYFNTSVIKKHQHEGLKDCIAAGGIGVVAVQFNVKLSRTEILTEAYLIAYSEKVTGSLPWAYIRDLALKSATQAQRLEEVGGYYNMKVISRLLNDVHCK